LLEIRFITFPIVTSSTSANEVVETLVYSVLLRAWMQNVEGSDVRT